MARSPSPTLSHASDPANYSIDLSALPAFDDGRRSPSLSEPELHHFDVVRTDDIDGPTDFTQNLEYWMRLKLPNITEPVRMNAQDRRDLEEYVSSEEPLSVTDSPSLGPDTSQIHHDIRGTITREVPDGDVPEIDGAADGDPNVGHVLLDDEASSTSERPTSRMQASVEGHHETPLRNTHSRSASMSGQNPRQDTSHLPQQSDQSKTITFLESALRSLKADLENVKRQSRADIKRVTQDFQTQLQHVKESNTLAISQKDAALRDEQKLRKAERAECTSYAELSDRLKERNAALEKDLNESRRAQLRLQDQMAALQNSFNEGLYKEEQQGRLTIEKLKEEHERQLRNQLLAPNAKIAQLEKLLEDARKASAVAEASEKTGLQKAVSRLNLEVARLSSRNFDLEQEAMDRLALTESQEQAAADLRKELEASQTEARMLREELSEIQNASVLEENKLRDEQRRLETERVHTVSRTEELVQLLEEANEAHSAEVERMKNGHALHVDNIRRNAETAVIKAGEVVEKQRKEKERLATELEAVKAKLNDGDTEVLDLRNEILVANDHAEDVERHRDELREELAAARAALERGEAEAAAGTREAEQARRDLAALRADYEEISEATAKRVAEVVRGKEKEWQRKMAELNTELDLRSKLLMIEWGRKEMGAADPQAYRYLD